jgi:hypothetical protein
MATAAAMEEPTLTATVNFFSVGEEESESGEESSATGEGSDPPSYYSSNASSLVPVESQLINGRLQPPTHPIEHGFGLRRHTSAVTDFYDYPHVRETLYPEYENLMRTLVPEAEHVFVGGHICRNPEGVRNGESFAEAVNAPHKFMHCALPSSAPPTKLSASHDWPQCRLSHPQPSPHAMTSSSVSSCPRLEPPHRCGAGPRC